MEISDPVTIREDAPRNLYVIVAINHGFAGLTLTCVKGRAR
jgi:hypothetical protein